VDQAGLAGSAADGTVETARAPVYILCRSGAANRGRSLRPDGSDGSDGNEGAMVIARTLLGRLRLGAMAGVGAAVVLAGCSNPDVEYTYPETSGRNKDAPRQSGDKKEPGLFGSGGLSLDIFGSSKNGRSDGAGIGVNSYLWRASLDTVSFMPLASADPFGGVIITDWYTPPESPSERFKMNVYILSRQLKADSVRVAVFRQEQSGENAWLDSTIKADTATTLENQILTRARQLRIASAANNK
jgi:hypothetical protein